MEQIRKFLQGKGFALVLAACLLAAAAAGVWAVQTSAGSCRKIWTACVIRPAAPALPPASTRGLT